MKRTLIAGALITTIATAGYIFTQKKASNEHAILDYIPANTALFSGQLTPFPIRAYINSISYHYNQSPDALITSLYANDSYDPADT